MMPLSGGQSWSRRPSGGAAHNERGGDVVELTDGRPGSTASGAGEQRARQQGIKQVKARRLFKISTTASAVGVVLLVPIWAATEYQHAGGWPTGGFSRSSGSPNVWNVWIVYPIIAWVSLTAARGWTVYRRNTNCSVSAE
jgi:hypothetical protein